MSGGPKGAERPLERPLDGRVRPRFGRAEAEKSARDAQIEAEVQRDAALLPATVLWAGSVKSGA